MSVDMLDFLMGHDIDLVCNSSGNIMSVDSLYELNGEFVVYDNKLGNMDGHPENHEVYRGTDFMEAVKILESA